MRNILKCLPILSICIFITACPYESPVPITPPSEQLIPSLLGKWVIAGSDRDYVQIQKLNQFHYQITNFEYDDIGDNITKTIYRAHSSTLGRDIFLNISPVDSEKETYFLYKIEFQGSDSLLLVEITDRIREKYSNSVELETFVKKYKDLSFFYGDETVYIKEEE